MDDLNELVELLKTAIRNFSRNRLVKAFHLKAIPENKLVFKGGLVYIEDNPNCLVPVGRRGLEMTIEEARASKDSFRKTLGKELALLIEDLKSKGFKNGDTIYLLGDISVDFKCDGERIVYDIFLNCVLPTVGGLN